MALTRSVPQPGDLEKIHSLFQRFFECLDAQRLRTPKGLDWIRSKYPALTQQELMLEMQRLRQMRSRRECQLQRPLNRRISSRATSLKSLSGSIPDPTLTRSRSSRTVRFGEK